MCAVLVFAQSPRQHPCEGRAQVGSRVGDMRGAPRRPCTRAAAARAASARHGCCGRQSPPATTGRGSSTRLASRTGTPSAQPWRRCLPCRQADKDTDRQTDGREVKRADGLVDSQNGVKPWCSQARQGLRPSYPQGSRTAAAIVMVVLERVLRRVSCESPTWVCPAFLDRSACDAVASCVVAFVAPVILEHRGLQPVC
jgi:hypothetical protein